MDKIKLAARWFFTGLRLFLPLVPPFLWLAIQEMYNSTVDYWKKSQSVVEGMADKYMCLATQKEVTEYDTYIYYVCYSIASFLYLLGWLATAWLSIQVFLIIVSAIF